MTSPPAGPTASTTTSPSRPARPQMGAMRTSSYLGELQQYRPPKSSPSPHHPPDSHFNIDTVVEGEVPPAAASPPKNYRPFPGVPSRENPPTVVDSGLNHGLSHAQCAPGPARKTDRLVATLFYKPTPPVSSHVGSHTGSNISLPIRSVVSPAPAAGGMPASVDTATAAEPISEPELPPNMAPTQDLEAFPLEPPTGAETEHLDHLYGSYISPLCMTSFLYLMSTFPLPKAPSGAETNGDSTAGLHSSHRCLDGPEHPRVVELTLSPAPSPDYLSLADLRKHELIYRFEREWGVDVVLQRDALWRRYPRLVVFDMDSTLITQEVIDLLAASVTEKPDLARQVADITHRAMLGELEFDAAFRERVQLLKGLSADIFVRLRPVLDVTRGVRPLLTALQRLGVKTAVLSGGFRPLTQWLAGELGIDYAYANEVVIDETTNTLTGEVSGVIVGKERKRELLMEIAAREGIDLSQVVAVGDGANDLLMLGTAGLGVAWNAKPMVQMEADARLNGESLLDLLYLFGFTSEEVAMLTA